MVYLSLVLAIGLFIVGIKILGIVPRVKLVVSATHDALAVMKSVELSEDEKEAAVQRAAVSMFGAFGSILLRVAVVCLVPVGFVLAGAKIGLYDSGELLRASTDWTFITVSTLIMIGALFLVK